MIELDHLTVSVGSFSVRDFSLAIPGGSCTFLMGPSGAGKTLVLETVAGIQAPKSGRVLIDGTDVTDLPPEHRRIGFVYQDYSLFPHYTVARNIGFGMRMRGKSHHDEERVTHDLLEELGIPHLAGRSPQTLSGGEQQRVALARALAIDPVVLLLDEPFAALDPRAREECIQALERVRRDRQVTILQVSHSRDEAYRLAGEVALIDQGTLLQSGPVERVFSRPRGRKAAAIAGYENILDAQVTGRADHILDLDLGGAMVRAPGDAPVGSTVCIGIRAGALQIIRGDLPPGPGANMIPGLINSLVCTDYVCHAAIRGAADLSVVMPRARAEGSGFRVGESVLVSFDCRDVLVLEQEGTAS